MIERADAAALLPQLQRAVVLATAATERFDRLWTDLADQDPEPLCVNCNQGSECSESVTISAWCSEYGHTPFAAAPGTTWEQAQVLHRQSAKWRD